MNNPLPSLADAKKYAEFIKEPKNGQIVVLNSVAPMKLSSGADIDDVTQKSLQKQLNRQGMLIVRSSNEEFKEGEKILLNEHPQFNVTRVFTSNNLLEHLDDKVKEGVTNKTDKYAKYSDSVISNFYRKFIIIVLHPNNIACTLS